MGITKKGRKRVTFTVDAGIFAEMMRAAEDAGVPRSVLGPMMDDVLRGLTMNFKKIAKAKRDGLQLSFGDLLGAHIGAVVDEVIKEGK